MKQIINSITKYPLSTFLNLLTLTIAFSGIVTIVLYVSYQYSFDKFNSNYSTVYQLQIDGEESTMPAVMSPIIKKNVSDIVSISPFWFSSSSISVPVPEKKTTSFYVSTIYANSDIFNMFTFRFIYGSSKGALDKTKSIVLTKSIAQKLFGDNNPVGKIVKYRGSDYTCTGVIADLPQTSSVQTECFASFETLLQQKGFGAEKWSEWSFRIFMKLSSPDRYQAVLKDINNIDEINSVINKSLESSSETDSHHLTLLPLSKLHFTESGQYVTVNPLVLEVLILLAFILAVMGIVNFVNLLTSQAMQRSRVFSVKRILGATKARLFVQIIIESVIVAFAALFIAILVHGYLNPYIETALGIRGLSFDGRFQWYFYFVAMAFVYALVASVYPARYITSVDVVQSVKGSYRFSGSGKKIRNTLITIQFVFTIVLLISSIAIEKQINFWHNFDIGIAKENIVFFRTSSNIVKHKDAFAKELMADPEIFDYTYTSFSPGSVGMMWGRNINGKQVSLYTWPVDERFIDFFGIKIVQGRKFSSNLKADLNSFIVNETAVKKYNWEKPLEILMPGFGFDGPIIGVSKDFNYASLRNKILPMQLWLTDWRPNVLMLKISGGNITRVLSNIKSVWQKFEPEADINIRFLDKSLDAQYGKEEQIARFIEAVTLWSILLAITGLMGLAIFISRQRTKEVGIRRANGASVSEIIQLFNLEFIKWILLAFIIAAPIAWYAVNKWLENFAYRTTVSWWVYLLAGAIVLIISLIAVTIQTIKVARKNPVKSLRYE